MANNILLILQKKNAPPKFVMVLPRLTMNMTTTYLYPILSTIRPMRLDLLQGSRLGNLWNFHRLFTEGLLQK